MLSGASVGTLFLAGIVPGLLMGLTVSLTIALVAKRYDLPEGTAVPISAIPGRLQNAALPMTLPVLLLGGIWSGFFSPTEAAAVAALWAIFMGAAILRTLRAGNLVEAFSESMQKTSSTMLLIASAFVVNYAIANEGLAASLVGMIDTWELSPLQFMLFVNVLLLLLGCFLDGSVILLVIVPLLLPAAKAFGIDLNHFGIVVIVNFMIGLITPPYGLLLFVLSGLTGVPLTKIFRAVIPFFTALIGLLALLILFPGITLFLPHLFGYQ